MILSRAKNPSLLAFTPVNTITHLPTIHQPTSSQHPANIQANSFHHPFSVDGPGSIEHCRSRGYFAAPNGPIMHKSVSPEREEVQHTEAEWEGQKESFRHLYMVMNLTRKEATAQMKELHNFYATPRQWERKIKQWGFSKYSSRDDRLSQIAQTGKSVYEFSRPDRHPRIRFDITDDRNLRRFARREISRRKSSFFAVCCWLRMS